MRGLWVAVLLVAGCFRHADAPSADKDAPCACRGHAPKALDAKKLCSAWKDATGEDSHASFPELDASSCFVRVLYHDGKLEPDAVPKGCGYPEANTNAIVSRELARYDAIAAGSTENLPRELACDLPSSERTRAARINATTLRATLARTATRTYPYAAVATFGYGRAMQEKSGLRNWRPDDACLVLSELQLSRLDQNVQRAERAAAAYHAGVAPVVIVSGGAVHSPVYESWILDYVLTCREHVPADAVLVDPCADHTHTNLRNTAGLVVAMGARTAYVVTTGIQVGYLQEWTTFDLIGGSLDQRSLRDFGYLIGTYRQASVGADHGFWLTPYRYFAEPRDGLGGLTCVR